MAKIRTIEGKLVDEKDYVAPDSGVKYYRENDKGEKEYINSYQRDNGDWTNDYYDSRRRELAGKEVYRPDGTKIKYDSYGDPVRYDASGRVIGSNATVNQYGIDTSFINNQKNTLNSMYGNRQSAEIEAIRRARDTNLQGYNLLETQANQSAYQNKNMADASTIQNVGRLREIMAAQGITGGDNVTAQTQVLSQGQNALANIDQAKANTLQDISQKRTLLNNQAADQEAALISSIEADKAQALMDLEKYGQEMSMRQDQINYDRYRDSISDQYRNDAFSYQQEQDRIDREMQESLLAYERDPSNPVNRLNLIRLEKEQIELNNLPKKLNLDNLAQQALINNRNASSTKKSSNGSTSGYTPGQGYTSTAQLSSDLSDLLKSNTYTTQQKRAMFTQLSQQYNNNPQMLEVIRRYSSYM